MSGGHIHFTLLRQSSYMSHILKELSKRNTHIPHIALYDEDKWQKVCSNAYFGFFTGGGHFWRVTRHSYLVRGLGKEPVTSQAEIPNPHLSVILYFSLITLTQFILKLLVTNKYSGMITMKTLLNGFLFSACDVTAWAREVKHWTSTEEKCNIKVRISLKPFNIQP